MLAARIPLPQPSSVHYVRLDLLGRDIESLEHARRTVLARNNNAHIQNSVLPTVLQPSIYLFSIHGSDFGPLEFDGLAVQESSSFTPPSFSSLLPSADQRLPITLFYHAVRSRLIDDIVSAASKKTASIQRHVKRFKNGFLMSHISSSSGWEYKAITRPLIFCQLQVHFSYTPDGVPSHLVIHPILQTTPFLDISRSLPLPPGTPISLAPFGTPAYYLANYAGPTAGLVKQFHVSLQGLGSGDWDDCSAHSPTFIIGWIKVENKQGEDKGLTIIYPSKLCLSHLPFASSRQPLEYIPELPAPLQPSPQAFHASLSVVESARHPASTPIHPYPRRPSLVTSPTSESLYSFRAMTLSSKDLRQVASEVGGYVDAVARERERERERLKRERESGIAMSPKNSRPGASTSAAHSSTTDPTTPSVPAPPPPPPAALSLPGASHAASLPPAQPSISMQTFYPSPPQSTPSIVPTSETRTSPTVAINSPFPLPEPTAMDTTSIDPPSMEPAPAIVQPPPPISGVSSFDPYSMDSAWAQPVNGYLGIDIDNMDFGMGNMGMNFSMDIDSMANTSSSAPSASSFNGRGGTAGGASMEFEDAFTDDDFSFFDRPSRPSGPTQPTQQFSGSHSRSTSGSHTLIDTTTGATLLSFGDVIGNPQPAGQHLNVAMPAHMWTPGAFIDNFTPHSIVDHTDSIPPELLPSSPALTPESHSAPATPNVHLDLDLSVRRPPVHPIGAASSNSLFKPIPFAPYHRQADGKYAIGKFALPSPPPEDISEPTFLSLPTSPAGSGWRFTYNAATDPRIGVVKKLIGVKRKVPPFAQSLENPPTKKPLWMIAHEEWESPRMEEGLKSEAEESESDDDEEEDNEDNDSNRVQSRPTTPPPSYLPLGPTLLATYFQHSNLLPLSVPLRPPGAAIAPLNLASQNPPPSVPTPVSPAATMGAASEKSRSLEAAAFAIAAEVVENPIWAETWKANAVGAKTVGAVWSTDVKAVSNLLESVPGLTAPVDMETLFGLDGSLVTSTAAGVNGIESQNMQPLEAPMISIGKGDAIIQVLPPALRFWEKLGLSPKSGRKDVTAFVLFEDNGHKQSLVEGWLLNIKDAYQGKHYGSMSRGNSPACGVDGLLPLRYDATFRKTLGAFVAGLTAPSPTTIVFLILPMTVMSLSSPVLRQILSVSKKALANNLTCQVFFEFIPEQHIYGGLEKSSAYDSALDVLASSVYNRILIPVDRLRSRRISNFDDGKDDTRFYFMAPSFSLARPLYSKVSFLHSPNASLDVMDRFALLHIGYHLTACGKWIVACCVDQRGENNDLAVWLTQSPGEHEGDAEHSDEDYAVKKVWDFGMRFAKKTNVEWRMVFARLGVMTEKEVHAWNTQLNLNVVNSRDQPALHHSFMCVVPDAPWSFLPAKPTPSSPISRPLGPSRSMSASKQANVFTDVSSTTYAVFPRNHLPISIPPSQSDLGLSQSFISEPPVSHLSPVSHSFSPANPNSLNVPQPASSAHSHPETSQESFTRPISLLPQATSLLIRVPHPQATSTTSTTMIHIHHLKTYHSAPSDVPDDKQLLVDVTRNFYELAVLAKARWKLDGTGGHKGLPFHLAATDAMRMALDRDWDRLEGGVEP